MLVVLQVEELPLRLVSKFYCCVLLMKFFVCLGWFPWIWRFFFVDDRSRERSIAELSAALKDLRQKVNDSVTILPRRYKEAVRLASVNVFDTHGDSIGVAIFVSSRRIISALHVFTKHYGFKKRKSVQFNKNAVIHGLLHRPDNKEEKAEFRMVDYKDSWDLAVLELVNCNDADHFVNLPHVGANDSQGNEEDDLDKLAVTSFTSALANQAPKEVDVSFCVCPAALLKVSKHHLLYSSSLFSGDSGGAVLLSRDGSLRGVHQESVNQASDELRRGATPAEMVKSINSLINGLSSGFIGLRLDVTEVQEFILNN